MEGKLKDLILKNKVVVLLLLIIVVLLSQLLVVKVPTPVEEPPMKDKNKERTDDVKVLDNPNSDYGTVPMDTLVPEPTVIVDN